MIDLFEAARQLQTFCDLEGWRSCFIGGLAVQRWGEPRVTRDIDLTVLAGFGNEERIIDPLLKNYAARIQDAREFALRRRVLLLAAPGGAGIDVLLGALPYEEKLINNATPFAFSPELEIRTCSAEDLIVLKLFAYRPLDVRDAEGVANRNRGCLDWRYIEEQLRPLAEMKQEPAILQTMEQLRET
jgi:Nucleotidyl transferase AbiEii toxin, Type IV TA system